MNEFIEELKNNEKVNKEKGLENRVDIDYVIERLNNIKKEDIYKNFNYECFKLELENSDLCALEYLEKRLINKLKEIVDKKGEFTREEYLISLFYAALELNNTNFISGLGEIENNFNSDIYFNVRDLLFKELEKELKKYV